MIAQAYPAVIVRDVETHHGGMPFGQRVKMVFHDELPGQLLTAKMLDILLAFIIEDIREAFVKDEG